MTNSSTESGTKRKRAPAPAERSRDRIMAAAAELARERGVSGATIAMVCQRSGLPVSSVYWYFEDKDQLFAEVIRTSFATWLVSVPRWDVSADTTIASGLRRVLGESVRTFADMPSFLRIGMQVLLETGEQHQKTRQAYIDVREQTRRMMTAWMTALLPDEVSGAVAEDLASLVIALSDGMSVGSQIYPDWQPDEYVELISSTIDAVVTTQASTMTIVWVALKRGRDSKRAAAAAPRHIFIAERSATPTLPDPECDPKFRGISVP